VIANTPNIVACACGQKNRVPFPMPPGKAAVCGRCKTVLVAAWNPPSAAAGSAPDPFDVLGAFDDDDDDVDDDLVDDDEEGL